MDLTPENFIAKIKSMDRAERTKLKLKDLIDLIVQAPMYTYDDNAAVMNLETSLTSLTARFDAFSTMCQSNVVEIAQLKVRNDELEKKNEEIRRELNDYRDANAEVVAPNNVVDRSGDIESLRKEINEIQQYLRINNLEIVGLPQANENESEENLILNALNNLEGISDVIRAEDIDISHPMKSQRTDGKRVHVVKFISRKIKADILDAKKLEPNKNYKFRNSDVFINEHLSPHNRSLFATAAGKKNNLNYKFLWTKGGKIFMRKTENSNIVNITCENDIDNLVWNCIQYLEQIIFAYFQNSKFKITPKLINH